MSVLPGWTVCLVLRETCQSSNMRQQWNEPTSREQSSHCFLSSNSHHIVVQFLTVWKRVLMFILLQVLRYFPIKETAFICVSSDILIWGLEFFCLHFNVVIELVFRKMVLFVGEKIVQWMSGYLLQIIT